MEYDFLSTAFLSALFAIVLMDLVLAGDNALIIGIVARDLPQDSRHKVIVCGAVGAIAVRTAMTVLVVFILKVPCFMLAGGLALVWISRKLLKSEPDGAASRAARAPAATFAGAIRTIIVADAVMGVDNVLAIGGAAHGSILLIVLGLAISVPIIVWGSHLVIRLVDRYPSVILLGGAVLAWTAYSMVVREPILAPWLETHVAIKLVIAILIFSISLGPWFRARLSGRMRPVTILLPALLTWMLIFEAAASVWQVEIDYLVVENGRVYLLESLRWLGWLPLLASFLWLRGRMGSHPRRAARLTGPHATDEAGLGAKH